MMEMTVEKTTQYWIGTLPNSPIANATIGGLSFPASTYTKTYTSDVNLFASKTKGKVENLTDEQITTIKKALKTKLVRWNIDKSRGNLVSTESPRYKARNTDEPFAKYVYMVEMNSTDWKYAHDFATNNEYPPSIYEMENKRANKTK